MTEEKRNDLSNLLLLAGLLVLAAMALLPLLNIFGAWIKWTFAAGAVIALVAQLMKKYDTDNLRIKRLGRMLVVSAVLYCASAAMMLLFDDRRDQIAFLLAGAMLQIYASWRMDAEVRKELKKQNNDKNA